MTPPRAPATVDAHFAGVALADLDAHLGILRRDVASLLRVLLQERLDPPLAAKVRRAIARGLGAIVAGELARCQLLN